MKALKKVKNKVSYKVKMDRQGDKGGLLLNVGYITARYMTQKVSHIAEIVTHLLCNVWQKINDTV